MVNPKDNAPRRDPLAPLAFLVLMLVLVWVGFNLVRVGWERRELGRSLNELVVLSNEGSPIAAASAFHEKLEEWQRRRATAAGFWLEKLQPFDLRIEENLATLHRSIGLGFSEKQIPSLAERHYTLALLYDPDAPGVAEHLPMECFYTRNYELGWTAIRMAQEEPDAHVPQHLVRFFQERYSATGSSGQ